MNAQNVGQKSFHSMSLANQFQASSSGVQLPMELLPSRRPQPGLSFLDLPRELQDMIYNIVFELEGGFFYYNSDTFEVLPLATKGGYPGSETKSIPGVEDSLLQSCKQIYSEARFIVYKNEFFFLWKKPCFKKLVTSNETKLILLEDHFPFLSNAPLRKVTICFPTAPFRCRDGTVECGAV